MPGPYLMGIDLGTESVRAGIFGTDGSPIVFRTQPYGISHPRPGWAEQNPDDWWTALGLASRRALADSGVPPGAIAGVGTDTTSCTVLALDKQFRPIRPAILWMDVRATEQARRIGESGHPALKYNGYGSVSAEWFPCKALWLKENEPAVYRDTAHLCECVDWLVYRLTGRYTANISTATGRCYYDSTVGGWQADFFAQIGLDDLLDKLPPEVLDLGCSVGGLLPEAAAHLGLPAGIPVAEGCSDGVTAQIGLGVVSPGRLAFITGSSHCMLGQSPVEFHVRGMTGAFPSLVIRDQYTVEAGQVSTGSIMKWFKDRFCGQWARQAETEGCSVYEILNREAGFVPPGSEGLIVLDHWQGNRSPYTDPESRGVIWGFSLRHTASHVARAIMEGVAYGTEQNLRMFRANGYDVAEMVICGGIVNSRLWMQIHADVSNVPITLTRGSETAATLGAAILGSVAGGLYPTIPAAVSAMVHVSGQVIPDRAAHETYKFYCEQYLATYPAMKSLLNGVARHVAGTP